MLRLGKRLTVGAGLLMARQCSNGNPTEMAVSVGGLMCSPTAVTRFGTKLVACLWMALPVRTMVPLSFSGPGMVDLNSDGSCSSLYLFQHGFYHQKRNELDLATSPHIKGFIAMREARSDELRANHIRYGIALDQCPTGSMIAPSEFGVAAKRSVTLKAPATRVNLTLQALCASETTTTTFWL